jgi:hypothetical protein
MSPQPIRPSEEAAIATKCHIIILYLAHAVIVELVVSSTSFHPVLGIRSILIVTWVDCFTFTCNGCLPPICTKALSAWTGMRATLTVGSELRRNTRRATTFDVVPSVRLVLKLQGANLPGLQGADRVVIKPQLVI